MAWVGFLCLLMVLGSIGEHSARGLFLVFIWLPWLVPILLLARYRLTAAGDTLTYRSPLRTRTWRRGEVGYFEIAYGRWSPRARLIQMRAADGKWVSFAITARSWPRDTAQVGRWYAVLEDWRLRACPVDHGSGWRSQILIEATLTVPRQTKSRLSYLVATARCWRSWPKARSTTLRCL